MSMSSLEEFTAAIVSGVPNFRDVGGLPAGNAHTRSGVLFRSGNLTKLDDGGRSALAGIGIRRIIDLRDEDEVRHAPSRVDGLSVQTQRVPLFLGSVASFFEQDISLAEMYRKITAESSQGVVDVVRGVLADQPVLVHCTVGKDRTGVTVALTLAAAGTDADAIVADYARTEALLPADRNRRIIESLQARHPEAVHLQDLATRSPAHVMHDLLAEVAEQYGSAGDYLRAHGLTDDELRELRRTLIVPD